MVLYAMCFASLPFSHDDPHVLKAFALPLCNFCVLLSFFLSFFLSFQSLIKSFVEEKRNDSAAPSAEEGRRRMRDLEHWLHLLHVGTEALDA